MGFVTKRLFDIDDELLERAQLALGTDSMTATVREALRRAAERDPGDAYVELVASLDPDADRSDMWR